MFYDILFVKMYLIRYSNMIQSSLFPRSVRLLLNVIKTQNSIAVASPIIGVAEGDTLAPSIKKDHLNPKHLSLALVDVHCG